MSSVSGAAGHAALAICESMLVSLTENKIIDEAEARAMHYIEKVNLARFAETTTVARPWPCASCSARSMGSPESCSTISPSPCAPDG